MNIQELVKQHYTKWMEVKKHTLPDLADCLDFMTTEVGEAIDKRLRQNPAYFRNNPEDAPSNAEIGVEVFDAIMMGGNRLAWVMPGDEEARSNLKALKVTGIDRQNRIISLAKDILAFKKDRSKVEITNKSRYDSDKQLAKKAKLLPPDF